MNIDLSQINNVEFDNIGAWPKQVKVFFGIILAVFVLAAGYMFVISEELERLMKYQNEEVRFRDDFTRKYHLAANLKLYREQLAFIEQQFTELLKMLPSQNEMPGLLDDLTFVATDAGLQITSIDWMPAIQRDFYVEYPIKMSVFGSYHQLGAMVSGVAKLSRIVSLHDFTIKREQTNELTMNILAKTYRFKEGVQLSPKRAKNK